MVQNNDRLHKLIYTTGDRNVVVILSDY